MRHEAPNFICREGKNRSEHKRERIKNFIKNGLSRTACCGCGNRSIKPVFKHIKIEVTHINNAEIVNCMRCCVILINFKAVSYRGDKLIQLHKSIFIKLFKAFICNLILIGIKIIKIAEAEASRISDFSVVIGKLLQDFGADSDICMIIRRSNPKTKNICAVFLNDILRSNAVSKGFRHFLPSPSTVQPWVMICLNGAPSP